MVLAALEVYRTTATSTSSSTRSRAWRAAAAAGARRRPRSATATGCEGRRAPTLTTAGSRRTRTRPWRCTTAAASRRRAAPAFELFSAGDPVARGGRGVRGAARRRRSEGHAAAHRACASRSRSDGWVDGASPAAPADLCFVCRSFRSRGSPPPPRTPLYCHNGHVSINSRRFAPRHLARTGMHLIYRISRLGGAPGAPSYVQRPIARREGVEAP